MMMIKNGSELRELTDEQLDEFEKFIIAEKQARKDEKQTKLFTAFEEAWKAIEAEGIEIWFSGNGYTSEEDLPLKFDDIYFD